MPDYTLDDDLKWFNEQLPELVKHWDGKVLAVRNREVLTSGKTAAEAAVRSGLPVGECLIRICSMEKNAHMAHIYTPGIVSL